MRNSLKKQKLCTSAKVKRPVLTPPHIKSYGLMGRPWPLHCTWCHWVERVKGTLQGHTPGASAAWTYCMEQQMREHMMKLYWQSMHVLCMYNAGQTTHCPSPIWWYTRLNMQTQWHMRAQSPHCLGYLPTPVNTTEWDHEPPQTT